MFPLGVLKKKQLKILKLTFTGNIVNEASTASNTQILQDGTVSIVGNKLNFNGSSDCSVQIEQLGGSDWFNLQRGFDLKFDLVIASNTTNGEIFTFRDSTDSNQLKLIYSIPSSGFSELRLWTSSPFVVTGLVSGFGVIPKNTVLNCELQFRKTTMKFFINGTLAIDVPVAPVYQNIQRVLWLGGAFNENTIIGSLDNVEMTLL